MNKLLAAVPVTMLLAVTAVWGWTFVVVRDAVTVYPVLPFLALRFILAAALLSPALKRRGSGLRTGILPGLFLAGGYIAQTVGLRYTTASKAGLLTGLLVVLTPLLALVIFGVRLHPLTALAAVIAVMGTTLLTSSGNLLVVRGSELLGDGLEILGALCFASHILVLSRVSKGQDASRLALSQMMVAAVVFSAGSVVSGGYPRPNLSILVAVFITGTLASAAAFWVQTYVQQRVSAVRTAIIMVAEPAFATLFGVWLAADSFSRPQATGALLIFVSLVVHEGAPVLRRRATRSAGT